MGLPPHRRPLPQPNLLTIQFLPLDRPDINLDFSARLSADIPLGGSRQDSRGRPRKRLLLPKSCEAGLTCGYALIP
jgi:hypothetical protein